MEIMYPLLWFFIPLSVQKRVFSLIWHSTTKLWLTPPPKKKKNMTLAYLWEAMMMSINQSVYEVSIPPGSNPSVTTP